jgi:hypothetical protein
VRLRRYRSGVINLTQNAFTSNRIDLPAPWK